MLTYSTESEWPTLPAITIQSHAPCTHIRSKSRIPETTFNYYNRLHQRFPITILVPSLLCTFYLDILSRPTVVLFDCKNKIKNMCPCNRDVKRLSTSITKTFFRRQSPIASLTQTELFCTLFMLFFVVVFLYNENELGWGMDLASLSCGLRDTK